MAGQPSAVHPGRLSSHPQRSYSKCKIVTNTCTWCSTPQSEAQLRPRPRTPAGAGHLSSASVQSSRCIACRSMQVSEESEVDGQVCGGAQEPERRRHLLRLWVSPPVDRPLPACYAELYASVAVGDRGGILCPGHAPKIALDAE